MSVNKEGSAHYKKCNIEPWDYILANDIPFLEGNVIKYVTRWRDAGGIKDLVKARHFIDKLIEHETRQKEMAVPIVGTAYYITCKRLATNTLVYWRLDGTGWSSDVARAVRYASREAAERELGEIAGRHHFADITLDTTRPEVLEVPCES